jgi:hypothetical protein
MSILKLESETSFPLLCFVKVKFSHKYNFYNISVLILLKYVELFHTYNERYLSCSISQYAFIRYVTSQVTRVYYNSVQINGLFK